MAHERPSTARVASWIVLIRKDSTLGMKAYASHRNQMKINPKKALFGVRSCYLMITPSSSNPDSSSEPGARGQYGDGDIAVPGKRCSEE